MTFLTMGAFFCSCSVQILVRATAVPVYAEELAMQKAMDTAVTVCLFILVTTVKVSRTYPKNQRACTFPDRIWDWLKKSIEEIMTQLQPCHRKQQKLWDKRTNQNTGLDEVQDYSRRNGHQRLNQACAPGRESSGKEVGEFFDDLPN